MALNPAQWLGLMCLCIFGIHTAYSFVAEVNDIMNNCRRDGGYCINTIPPPPPRQRARPRGRGRGRGRAGPTQTRRGSRPSARQMGASHQRLPGSPAGGAAPLSPAAPVSGRAAPPPYPAQQAQQPKQTPNDPFAALFGPSNPNNPMGNLMPFMFFTRRKRQAAEPVEAAERPKIRRGENLFNFLNTHCRKSEFDFGCRQQGGMCCLPHL